MLVLTSREVERDAVHIVDYHAVNLLLVFMSQTIRLELVAPDDLAGLRLPPGVQRRLNELLDKQDLGTSLTEAELSEAEGLVDLVDLLSLLQMQAGDRFCEVTPLGGEQVLSWN